MYSDKTTSKYIITIKIVIICMKIDIFMTQIIPLLLHSNYEGEQSATLQLTA